MYIFNWSLSCGTFPEKWKHSIINPPLKKPPIQLDNLRPVSITPIISRRFERLVYDFYLKDRYLNIVDPHQFGFRKFGSTASLIIKIQNFINKMQHQNFDYVRIFSIDLSKAFDKVQHYNILTCLQNYEFNPYVINRVNSFLSNRCQSVSCDGALSQHRDIETRPRLRDRDSRPICSRPRDLE